MTATFTPAGLIAGNDRYAATFAAGGLTAPPARALALVTCMDARIEPLSVFGLDLGDSHVMRNAGGRVTDDVLRSLMVSTVALGVREVLVVQHDDCGMSKATDAQLRSRVEAATGHDPAGIEFLTFTDVEASVVADVERVRSTAGILAERVAGLVYDVRTGRVRQVA
jgi:carbonic anhydrase